MRASNAFDRRERPRGFTLLEVMIALAVVSIGLAAASSSIAHITANGVYLRDKTFGNWIAMNKLSEMRLAEAWPAIGKSDDEVDYAGLHWHWTAEVSATDVETLHRIDVTVARKDKGAEEHVVAKLSGFVGQPRTGGGMPTPWTGVAAPGQQGGGGSQQQPGTQQPPEDQGDEDSGNQDDGGDDNGNGDQSGDQEQQ